MLSPPRESAEAGRLFLRVIFLRLPSVADASLVRFLLPDVPKRPIPMPPPTLFFFFLALMLLWLDPDLFWEPEDEEDEDEEDEDEDEDEVKDPTISLFPCAPRM